LPVKLNWEDTLNGNEMQEKLLLYHNAGVTPVS